MNPFSLSVLSETVYKITERDRFGENPFMYVIIGENQSILIDTGCGTGDLQEFLQSELFSREEIPETVKNRLLIINSHNHFDHIGANYRFSPEDAEKAPEVIDLCASDGDIDHTTDPLNSLGHVVGSLIPPYKITRWLSDGEKIYLSDDQTNYLEVIHVPGHTPDCLALYYPKENKIFVADFIYRFAPILAVGANSDMAQFENSARKLMDFVQAKESESGTKLTLCCGHIDDDLESKYLADLLKLLEDVRDKKISGSSMYGGNAKLYANGDCLAVAVGKLPGT